MQLGLETLFDTQFADVLGTTVVGRVVRLLKHFLFGGVDSTDVANHVTGQFTKRVVAKQPRLDVNARKTVALGGKFGHLRIAQATTQRQRFKTFGFFAQFLEAPSVTRSDLKHSGEFVNGLLQIGNFRRRHLQCVGRIVARQHNPVAVQDQTAIGHDRHDGGPVVFGLCPQVVVSHHLQVNQTRHHQPKTRHDHQARYQNPHPEARQLGLNVSNDGHAAQSGRLASGSGARR
jgi:hypothetical protein